MNDNIYSMISWHKTGSNYICNPPVTNTDVDYIILVGDWELAHQWMLENDFVTCGEDSYGGNLFEAFRKGNLNYIITYDLVFYDRFCAATELAKLKNLKYKSDRIALFKSILYGIKDGKLNDYNILGALYEA